MFTKSGFRVRNVICAVLSSNEVDLLMLRKRVFWKRNDQKCAVQSWKEFDLLKLMNRVLRLGNVHIWVVPPCYMVDLLIHRNRVFRLRNVQVWLVLSWKVVVLNDFHEICFQAAKRSDMDCMELQGGLFADCQELYLRLRKFQIRTVPSCKKVDLILLRISVFRARNIEIWAVMSSNEDDFLMLTNRVFRLRNDQLGGVRSWKVVV